MKKEFWSSLIVLIVVGCQQSSGNEPSETANEPIVNQRTGPPVSDDGVSKISQGDDPVFADQWNYLDVSKTVANSDCLNDDECEVRPVDICQFSTHSHTIAIVRVVKEPEVQPPCPGPFRDSYFKFKFEALDVVAGFDLPMELDAIGFVTNHDYDIGARDILLGNFRRTSREWVLVHSVKIEPVEGDEINIAGSDVPVDLPNRYSQLSMEAQEQLSNYNNNPRCPERPTWFDDDAFYSIVHQNNYCDSEPPVNNRGSDEQPGDADEGAERSESFERD